MKKIFIFIVAMCCIVTMRSEQISGECGPAITWSLNTSTGVFTFEGAGLMYDYTSQNAVPWHSYCNIIRSVSYKTGSSFPNLGGFAFIGCTNLQAVELPATVKSIGDYAFKGCKSLTSFSFTPDMELGSNAFFGSGLTSVYLPEGVTLGNGTFRECLDVTEFTVSPSNNTLTAVDGVLFSKDKKTLIVFPVADNRNRTSYAVPEGTVTIDCGAFSYSELTNLYLPATISSIELLAFSYMANLKTVRCLATTPPAIHYQAFQGCNLSAATLFVPMGAIAIYASTDTWEEFGEIKETNGTGLEETYHSASKSAKVFRDGVIFIEKDGNTYTLSGIKLQ